MKRKFSKFVFLGFFFLAACTTAPTADSFVAQGKEVAKEKKYEEALAFYEKALAVESNNASALFNAGVACAKLARNDKALEYFNALLEPKKVGRHDYYADTHYNIASIKLAQDKYKEAIDAALPSRPYTEDLIKKALEKLKKTGFQYSPDVQVPTPITIPYPDDRKPFADADEAKKNIGVTDTESTQTKIRLNLVAIIDHQGIVRTSKCDKKVHVVYDKGLTSFDSTALCEYVSDQIKKITFIPAYDFIWDAPAASVTYFDITFEANATVSVSWNSIAGAAEKGPAIKTTDSNDSSSGEKAPVWGALHRQSIDHVIKQRLNRIRWCYEKELNKDRKLAGKIVVKFTISKTGEVSSAETFASTMNNATVESCVNQRIEEMLFPIPAGNGIVIVTYPFIFKHAD